MWLDHNSSRSLYRRRSQPPIFPGLFLGVLPNDIVIWFWIGSHDNYERLIKSGDEDFPVGVTVHRRVGWEREEWGIGNRILRVVAILF